MKKLIVSYIGDSCAEFLPLSFDSIKNITDKIIFVWGMEDIKTKQILDKYKEELQDKLIIIESKYSQEYKEQNGRQRNIYLKYLQENYKGYLNLVLDPDEIVDEKFKEFIKSDEIQSMKENHLLSIHMRHTIRDLRHEDATVDQHFVHNRLFRVCDELEYPETEHPILISKSPNVQYGYTNKFCIWHIGYSREMFAIKKKFDNHRVKSEIHTQQFLRQWYAWHLFGKYPVKEFNPTELPKIIKDYFEIIPDELYFEERKQLELKNIIDIWQWKQAFNLTPDKVVLDVGCGAGHRVLAGLQSGLNIWGFDKSLYIIENPVYPDLVKSFPESSRLTYGDIVAPIINKDIPKKYNFIICYDILEHLTYEDLDKAITHLIQLGVDKAKYLISVPVIGDPNLEKDNTHKIKETKEWWNKKFEERGFNILETPQWFNYHWQIIVLEKK